MRGNRPAYSYDSVPAVEGSSHQETTPVFDRMAEWGRKARTTVMPADLLLSAVIPVLETLEDRRLLSSTTVQALPFVLDFSSDRGEILDKDGQGTGFTRVQANKLGNEYQPNLIDLDTNAGVLKITTAGNSSAGSNSLSDNTQVDALE